MSWTHKFTISIKNFQNLNYVSNFNNNFKDSYTLIHHDASNGYMRVMVSDVETLSGSKMVVYRRAVQYKVNKWQKFFGRTCSIAKQKSSRFHIIPFSCIIFPEQLGKKIDLRREVKHSVKKLHPKASTFHLMHRTRISRISRSIE